MASALHCLISIPPEVKRVRLLYGNETCAVGGGDHSLSVLLGRHKQIEIGFEARAGARVPQEYGPAS